MLEYLDPEYGELVKLCWVFVPQGVCFIEYCAFWTCFGIVKVYVFWFEYLGLNGTYLLYRNKSKFLLHLLRFNFFIKNKLGGKNKLVYFLFVFEIKLFEILNSPSPKAILEGIKEGCPSGKTLKAEDQQMLMRYFS